jgi:orotate phosphoribosyltransferase
MMKQESYLDTMKNCSAVLGGHFLLTSGLHSATYIEKFKVLQYPLVTEKLCRGLAEHFADTKPHVIVGAAIGGIIISHVVARFLSCRSIFAERENGTLLFKRGFQIEPKERVLIVDDIITTGGSIFELIDLVTKTDCHVIGIGALIDRSGGKVDFGLPTFPLITMDIPVFKPEDCPLCADKVPLTARGRTGK